MASFQSEIPLLIFTVKATGVLVAGDPVDGDGLKATGVLDFAGIAVSDAAIGEHVSIVSSGIVAVKLDTGGTVTKADRMRYLTNGYDTAGVEPSFGIALETGGNSDYVRMLLSGNNFPGALGAALTTALTALTHTAPTPDYAIQNLTSSSPFGFVTADEGNTVLSVIVNNAVRIGELEARLQAALILT